jgi:hypothetical protein
MKTTEKQQVQDKTQSTRNFILRENVLTDNLLILPPKGYRFKGGYIAVIKEYVYQSAWSDKEIVKKFMSENSFCY